jgi:hypothetical protein
MSAQDVNIMEDELMMMDFVSPNLGPASPKTPVNSRKRGTSGAPKTGAARGRNWTEFDSLLLVSAYKYAEENKKCMIMSTKRS